MKRALLLFVPEPTKPEPTARNSLQDAVHPVCSVMRCIGAWPARKPRDAVTALQLAGQVVLLVLLGYQWLNALDGRQGASPEDSPEEGEGGDGSQPTGERLSVTARTSLSIQSTMYLAMFWTLPFIWWDATRLMAVWEEWGPLQARLERTCGGSRLRSSRSASLQMSVALAVAWPPIVALPLHLLPATSMPILDALLYAHSTLFTLLLKLLWWRMMGALDEAAELLAKSFKKDAVSWSGPLSAMKVRTYRELWMSMRDVLDDVGQAGGLSQLYVQAIQTLALLVFTVQMLMSLIEGQTIANGWMTFLGFVTFYTMAALSDGGSRIINKMNRVPVLLETIPTINLDSAVEYEIDVFRESMAYKSAAIRLCGFVTVDRSLLGSVLVILMTHLMVLLQFALL